MANSGAAPHNQFDTNLWHAQPVLRQFKNHSVLVLGLGREGFSSYSWLRAALPDLPILISDESDIETIDPVWKKILADDPATEWIAFSELPQLSAKTELVICKTPGFPLSRVRQELGLAQPVTSNTQLFLELVANYNQETPQPPQTTQWTLHPITIIGVTGTKGKSTTTAVIHHVISASSFPTFLGGNIGVPPLDLVSKISPQLGKNTCLVSLELSCHQLSELTLSPHWAVVLAITPEHLDYYPNFESYVAAKSQITRHQKPSDVVLFEPTNAATKQIATLSVGNQVAYQVTATPELKNESRQPLELNITTQNTTTQQKSIIRTLLENVALRGQHNWHNMAPAIIIGQAVGLSSDEVSQQLQSFEPLPHRLQVVGTFNGIACINDSLSTTPEATVAALKTLPAANTILIAGGFDRSLEYEPLAEALLQQPPKLVILFSPSGERIQAAIAARSRETSPEIPIIFVTTMSEAVAAAKDKAKSGDTILLSPASASFGLFVDYQDRGNQFATEVKRQFSA